MREVEKADVQTNVSDINFDNNFMLISQMENS